MGLSMYLRQRMADKWKQMASNPAAAQAEMAKMIDASNLSTWTRFTRAPLVLKAFVIYAVSAAVVGLILQFVLPFGTSSRLFFLVFRYLLPLYFTHKALSRLEMRMTIYAVAMVLVAYGVIGSSQFWMFISMGSRIPAGFQYSAPQVVLEFVVPIAWALLLVCPSMRKWIHAKSDSEAQVHQISMADLMYFMFVASVAMMASIAMIRNLN
jgi:cell shape-determining protein MreD